MTRILSSTPTNTMVLGTYFLLELYQAFSTYHINNPHNGAIEKRVEVKKLRRLREHLLLITQQGRQIHDSNSDMTDSSPEALCSPASFFLHPLPLSKFVSHHLFFELTPGASLPLTVDLPPNCCLQHIHLHKNKVNHNASLLEIFHRALQ